MMVAVALSVTVASGRECDGGLPAGPRQAAEARTSPPGDDLRTTEPVTWPSSALGLARPGMAYAKMLTAGLRLELKARTRHLLLPPHTSDRRFQYAGSAPRVVGPPRRSTWSRDRGRGPNLNGNLLQLSLLGTNPLTAAQGRNRFRAASGRLNLRVCGRTSPLRLRSGLPRPRHPRGGENHCWRLRPGLSGPCAARGGQYAVFYKPGLGSRLGR